MRSTGALIAIVAAVAAASPALPAQQGNRPAQQAAADDPVQRLVDQLDLERYKATIKGLTAFGDRRQGTQRNRDAVDWIESKLREYGCATERMTYEHPAPQGSVVAPPVAPAADGSEPPRFPGRPLTRGNRGPTGVNNDSLRQPDLRLRELNREQTSPGPREQVYCTKVGTTRPGEMYIIGAHMDGIGWGEAANDDGSGTAIVMELARILNAPGVETEVSIRFILWNNEESGLNGSRAYVAQRHALQGIESPAGSGKYPEPKWLGMIQHDMMMFDHGMPGPDGKVSDRQRPEADVNIEFQWVSRYARESQDLAWFFRAANERYATDYPAAVGNRMSNTDSAPFQDYTAAVSMRENERLAHIGSGWNPHWHQPTDLFATFSDDDFRLGLNAAQTTLAAIARLSGAVIR